MREYSDEEIDAWIEEHTQPMDSFAYFGDEDLSMNAVFYTTHRDVDCLGESNWRRILADAQEKFPESFWVMKCNHWAVGWMDHLMVDVTDREAVAWCMDVLDELEDYPVYDESDLSEVEHEATWNTFTSCTVHDVGKYLEQRQFELEGYVEEGDELNAFETDLLAAIRWFDSLDQDATELLLWTALKEEVDHAGSGDDFCIDTDDSDVRQAVVDHLLATWRAGVAAENYNPNQLELAL